MTYFNSLIVGISDLIVSISFIIVSITLYIISKNSKISFRSLFLALSLLVAAYTATHMIDVALSWKPLHWLYLLKKSITLFTAVGMTILLFKIKPQTEKAIRAVFDLENVIKENEKKLNIIFEGAKIGSWEWDLKDTNIWNSQNQILFGYEPGTAIRTFKEFIDRVHPEDRAALINDSLHAIAAKTYSQREFRVVWPDKSIHWLLTLGQIVYDNSGTPLKMTGITIDTTEQKNTLEELIKNQEQVSLATEIAKIGIWETDAKTKLYKCSKITAEIFGLSNDTQFNTHSFFETVYPDDKLTVHKALDQAFSRRDDSFMRFRIIRADKTVRWISCRTRPFFDSKDQLTRFIGTVRDITEEKKYEEVLSNQRKWLELVLDKMPIPLTLIEPNTTHITLSNTASDSYFKGKFLTTNVTEAEGISGIKITTNELPGAKAARGEKIENYEMNLITTQGLRTLLINSSTLEAQYGQPASIIMTYQDITKNKEAERQLEEALGLRDEFISIASHELKTPLTSLKLQLDMTKRQIDPQVNRIPAPEKLNKIFDTSIQQVKKLSTLIDDLLDVSKIRAGKMSYNFAETNVSDLIYRSVERMLTQIKNADCKLKFNIEKSMIAIWDADRIEQILSNLISNAVKYAPQSHITVNAEKRANKIVISVNDDGPGIPKEVQQIIFNRFERGRSQHEATGLGIGLYIAREIAVGHHGELFLISELNTGSTFTLEVPVDPREAKV